MLSLGNWFSTSLGAFSQAMRIQKTYVSLLIASKTCIVASKGFLAVNNRHSAFQGFHCVLRLPLRNRNLLKWPSYTNAVDSSLIVVETRHFSRTGLLVSTSQPAEPMNRSTSVPEIEKQRIVSRRDDKILISFGSKKDRSSHVGKEQQYSVITLGLF